MILLCTLAFHSLDPPGLPGRVVERLLNDNISVLFLSVGNIVAGAFAGWIIFLAGSVASTGLIRLSVGKI